MVSPAGGFFIALAVILLRARRLGLPAPPLSSYNPFSRSGSSSSTSAYGTPRPRSGGIGGWFSARLSALRNPRSATGAYEQTSGGGRAGGGGAGGRRGFGPLDPDEAWDARVGHEADYGAGAGYYEEQELGYTSTTRGRAGGGGGHDANNNAFAGSGYAMNLAVGDEERGRSASRGGADSLDVVPPRSRPNPFDDDAEPSNLSLRGVSPRPMVDTAAAAASAKKAGQGQGHTGG
ncbi:hypothetical protein F4778DRAFT_767423 [Xylariomycetidae sp. FL2044]|nr:hypothetical protein F4778DRAFT_767423 [Xylariomycetidae sp. FL2044]